MGFAKWIARRGGPGSAARWAAKRYRQIREAEPNLETTRDIDVFRFIVASRYAIIPHRKAQAFLEGWLQNENQGLISVVQGIVIAESKWEPFEFPRVILDAIHEELSNSGLPESVLYGAPRNPITTANPPTEKTHIHSLSAVRVIFATADKDLAQHFSTAVQSALPNGVLFYALQPETARDADLWSLANEQNWDLAILLMDNIVYSSYSQSRATLQDDSMKFLRKMTQRFEQPIVCCYSSASWLTDDYPQQMLQAGARALIHIPCKNEVIRQTVQACLSLR
jgi:hypothetical protein